MTQKTESRGFWPTFFTLGRLFALVPDLSIADRLRKTVLAQYLASWQSKGKRRTKWQSYYVQKAKTDATSCKNCVWFIPPSVEVPFSSCRLVDPVGTPDDGFINSAGTCGLWNAGPARIAMEDTLRGRGPDAKGIAPGNLRVRLEELAVKGERTTPPEHVARRLMIKSDLIKDKGTDGPRPPPHHPDLESTRIPDAPAPTSAPPQAPPPLPLLHPDLPRISKTDAKASTFKS